MFKYSFMTFACPEYSLEQVIDAAVRHGYDGIEPRVAEDHQHGIELGLSEEERAGVRRAFEEAGIVISCLATSIRLNRPAPAERHQMVELTERYCELAADLRCERVRVFGGRAEDDPDRDTAFNRVVVGLQESVEMAEDCGVCLCLETHDDFSAGADVVAVCEAVDSPSVRVNWDTQHTITAGEDFAMTASFLMPYVEHVHFHDVNRAGGKNDLVPIGEGQEPIAKFLSLFRKHNYDGFLSGEWFYNHGPEIDLAHYIKSLRALENAG